VPALLEEIAGTLICNLTRVNAFDSCCRASEDNGAQVAGNDESDGPGAAEEPGDADEPGDVDGSGDTED
jgi:hypothetical protein